VKPEGKGPKGKLTAAQSSQYKKALKGKEDEGKLAEKLRELVPLIEKEEAVSLQLVPTRSWLMGSESRGPRRGSRLPPTSPTWPSGGVREQGEPPGKSIIHMVSRRMKR